jgi:hypothetical protein
VKELEPERPRDRPGHNSSFDPITKELFSAIAANTAAANKLIKYQQRGFDQKIPQLVEATKAARRRLANAWDANRARFLEQ